MIKLRASKMIPKWWVSFRELFCVDEIFHKNVLRKLGNIKNRTFYQVFFIQRIQEKKSDF